MVFFFWSAAGPSVLGTDADRRYLGGSTCAEHEALLWGTSPEEWEGKERGREGSANGTLTTRLVLGQHAVRQPHNA